MYIRSDACARTGAGDHLVLSTALSGNVVDFAVVSQLPAQQDMVAASDLISYSMAAQAIVPVVNLPGLGEQELVLSGDVLARIFLVRGDRACPSFPSPVCVCAGQYHDLE